MGIYFDIKLTSKFKEQISKLISKIKVEDNVNLSKYANSIFIVPFYNVQIIVKDEEDYNNKDKERIIDVVTGSNYDNFHLRISLYYIIQKIKR